jgi:ABC-2 type transport system permease protein
MKGLRVFFVGGLISYRALFSFMSPAVFIPALILTPIFQILLFAYIGRAAHLRSDEFYVVGNAMQYSAVPCLFAMTQTIAGERYQQTLGYILVSPAGRLPLFPGARCPSF